MKQSIRLSILLVGLVVLSGCVSVTPNFAAKPDFWDQKNQVVGVAVAKLPQPAALKGGSQGLLDMAINNAMAGSLQEYLGTLDITRVNDTADRVAGHLRQKGFMVKRVKDPVDILGLAEMEKVEGQPGYFAKRDFRPLKDQLQVGKLLVISVDSVGTLRNYYGFIPLGPPVGHSRMSGQIINLTNNSLEWNQAVTQTAPVSDGEWDVPPSYPALTTAIFSAYGQSQEVLYNNFVQ